MTSAEFVINNKTYSTTKVSPFMANYRKKLRMGVDLRRKGKMEKATKFAERIKKMQKKARVALTKAQKEMKKQVNRERKKVEV